MVLHPPRDAASLPGILYGTAWKKGATASLVQRAIELGFRGVDTACQPKHYDEAGVGRGVAACLGRVLERHELYLQTKFTPLGGQDPRRVPYDVSADIAAQVRQSCAASLRNLGVSRLDALLLHSPLRRFEETCQAWRAMEAEVDAGRVTSIGISNCYDPGVLDALWQAARVKPSLVQNRFYAETGYDRELRALCRDRGLSYQSFWTLSANPHILAHPVLAASAARRTATPAQIFFRFLTQRGITPLSGTTSELHMQQGLAIFQLELDPDELDAIESLLV